MELKIPNYLKLSNSKLKSLEHHHSKISWEINKVQKYPESLQSAYTQFNKKVENIQKFCQKLMEYSQREGDNSTATDYQRAREIVSKQVKNALEQFISEIVEYNKKLQTNESSNVEELASSLRLLKEDLARDLNSNADLDESTSKPQDPGKNSDSRLFKKLQDLLPSLSHKQQLELLKNATLFLWAASQIGGVLGSDSSAGQQDRANDNDAFIKYNLLNLCGVAVSFGGPMVTGIFRDSIKQLTGNRRVARGLPYVFPLLGAGMPQLEPKFSGAFGPRYALFHLAMCMFYGYQGEKLGYRLRQGRNGPNNSARDVNNYRDTNV